MNTLFARLQFRRIKDLVLHRSFSCSGGQNIVMKNNDYINKSMGQPPKLPHYFNHAGPRPLRLCLDYMQEQHAQAFEEMMQRAKQDGDGFAKDEDTKDLVQNITSKTNPLYFGLVLIDTSNSAVAACHTIFPSGLVRSEMPVYNGSYNVVNSDYRGLGLAELLSTPLESFVSKMYLGMLGRMTIVGHMIPTAIKRKGLFLGLVPYCTLLSTSGWTHDVAALKPLIEGKWTVKEEELAQRCTLPHLGDKASLVQTLPMFKRWSPNSTSHNVHHNTLGKLKVSAATIEDIWTIQEIMRENAMQGNGFGLDEFTSNGVYNEKLIRDCQYWVTRQESTGALVAVILAGNAGLTRVINKKQCTGCIIVLQPYRCQGIGQSLLNVCENEAVRLGYDYVLTDVLASNSPGLGLMRKNNYLVTCTIPKTCYVSGYGYSNTFIHWKSIEKNDMLSTL